MSEIATAYASNFRDIPATLRRLADEIERDECTDVKSCVVVLQCVDSIKVHGLGRGDLAYHHLLLLCGARSLEDAYRDR